MTDTRDAGVQAIPETTPGRTPETKSVNLIPTVILISGRGTNMCQLVDRAQSGRLAIDVRAVISDRIDAAGLQSAHERGIETVALPGKEFATRAEFDAHLAECVARYCPKLVILAGYMKILSTAFVRQFAGCLLNIHPSLLPRYPGLHTHRQVLANGDRNHGATVHFVVEELDSGPMIVQGRVTVLPQDTESSLAARVQYAEHNIYPMAVEWFAAGRLAMRDAQTWLDGRRLEHPVVIDFSECTQT